MAQLTAGWGLPPNTGRIWAYLLLQPGPASLDEIAGELGIAKSGASVGSRQLVQLGLARGMGERGSRRLRYEALHNLEAIFAARNASLVTFLERLRQGTGVAPPGVARERLAEMADMVQALADEVPAFLQRLREM
ncbi:MAG TPA: transcriptional regulator, partial [Candidatus Dormibacteraeota bacterium]